MVTYTDEERLKIALEEYEVSSIGEQVAIGKDDEIVIGTVTQVYDNEHGNGEQVYAVVSDPTQDPSEVQEVTVLFRGSAGPDKLLSRDFWNDWVENDLPIGLRIFAQDHPNYTQDHDHASGQLKAASAALDEIMTIYPNAKFNLYGHSLGSMDTQYAIANLSEENIGRIASAHIYNGPNIYGILDNHQKTRVDSIKGLIYNYADPKDPISMVGRQLDKGSIDSVGMVHFVDSKDTSIGDQHMTLGYQLDEDGKIKVLKTLETGPVNQVLVGMLEFQQYKTTLGVDGLSSSEKIFLDGEQARVVASGFSTLAELAHEQIEQAAKDAVAEAEELYQSLNEVPWGFFYLNPSDVQAAYAAGGVDYNTTVGKIEEYSQKKVSKSAEILASSKTLSENLLSGINQIEAQDQALSGIFGR